MMPTTMTRYVGHALLGKALLHLGDQLHAADQIDSPTPSTSSATGGDVLAAVSRYLVDDLEPASRARGRRSISASSVRRALACRFGGAGRCRPHPSQRPVPRAVASCPASATPTPPVTPVGARFWPNAWRSAPTTPPRSLRPGARLVSVAPMGVGFSLGATSTASSTADWSRCNRRCSTSAMSGASASIALMAVSRSACSGNGYNLGAQVTPMTSGTGLIQRDAQCVRRQSPSCIRFRQPPRHRPSAWTRSIFGLRALDELGGLGLDDVNRGDRLQDQPNADRLLQAQ